MPLIKTNLAGYTLIETSLPPLRSPRSTAAGNPSHRRSSYYGLREDAVNRRIYKMSNPHGSRGRASNTD